MNAKEGSPRVEHEPRIGYMPLSLISPEYARSLGIPTECPVFVGANTQLTSERTGKAPLIYQAQKVTSRGFVRESEIYFSTLHPDTFPFNGDWELDTDDFLAVVQPVGDIKKALDDNRFITDAAYVTEMLLYCRRGNRKVDTGVIYPNKFNEGLLHPFCADEEHSDFEDHFKDLEPQYYFKVVEGKILFTRP